ncbi:MAG: discoidin domain-containing protein [Candidatus Brocadiia bacterium]
MRRCHQRISILTVALVVLAATVFAASARAADSDLAVQVGPDGLRALKWTGADILDDGKPRVGKIVLETKRRGEEGVNQYAFETLDGGAPEVRFDLAANRVTYAYPWGSVDFNYAPGPSRLDLSVTLRNTSDRTIAMFDITPLTLAPPDPIEVPKHWRGLADLPGDFNVTEAICGKWKYLLCCETIMPLHFGFDKPRQKNTLLPTTVRGGVNIMEPGGVLYHHYGLPRIEPGKSLTIKLSLRFAPADSDTDTLLADMFQAFRDYHQPRMTWKDRRPIGAIFIGSGRGPDNNPRYWFKDDKLDVGTSEGRGQLREKMMQHADRCIAVLKSVNAQGMVLWDPEGGENPHPTTYIGDPRMVELVAPEVADIYPEYFRRFRDAGLRVGCCLRPTQVYLTPPSAACDGDLGSSWAVQVYPQWIEVDLGQDQPVAATEVVCNADRAYQYTVETKASDGNEYRVIVDRRGNETPGSAKAPIRDEFEPVTVRYVRLTVTGAHGYDGDWINIPEFRVLSPRGDNLAVGKVSGSSRPLGRSVGGHGTGSHNPKRNPLGDDFSDIWPEGEPWWRFFPVVERMSRKIEYAKENWGCTIFYVDTNGVHRPVGEKQEFKWTLLDPLVWREIHKRHPDVLLIPEFAPDPAQLAYTSSYLQPPYSPAVTRPFWRKLLPDAFSVSYTVNLGTEDWEKLRPQLIKGIGEGDSMFFRGWFGCAYNRKIKALYDEVYEPDAVNPFK